MRKPKSVKEKALELERQKPNKLKDYVDNSIWSYPTLYRANTYEESRLLVLAHVFLCYGTGLEWHPKGFLTDLEYSPEGQESYTILGPKKLPEDFFTAELWSIDFKKEDKEAIKAALKGHFHYFRGRGLHGDASVIFQSDEQFANKLTLKYDARKDQDYVKEMKKFGCDYLRPRDVKAFRQTPEVLYAPYPMSRYSPLVEMVKGRTDSCHTDNFDLKVIQPDWIEGAIEIARYTLEFYNDPKKCVLDSYHPAKCFRDFKQRYDQDPVKYREERKADGMLPEHTIEQWSQICWENHRKEQIGYCEKFLKKFAPSPKTAKTAKTAKKRTAEKIAQPKKSLDIF